MSDGEYTKLDTNHDGHLDYKEIAEALKKLAASFHYTITDKDWAWVKEAGKAIDTKDPGVVDKHEFNEFANAVADHCDFVNISPEKPNHQVHLMTMMTKRDNVHLYHRHRPTKIMLPCAMRKKLRN
jgi:hypothetical protein